MALADRCALHPRAQIFPHTGSFDALVVGGLRIPVVTCRAVFLGVRDALSRLRSAMAQKAGPDSTAHLVLAQVFPDTGAVDALVVQRAADTIVTRGAVRFAGHRAVSRERVAHARVVALVDGAALLLGAEVAHFTPTIETTVVQGVAAPRSIRQELLIARRVVAEDNTARLFDFRAELVPARYHLPTHEAVTRPVFTALTVPSSVAARRPVAHRGLTGPSLRLAVRAHICPNTHPCLAHVVHCRRVAVIAWCLIGDTWHVAHPSVIVAHSRALTLRGWGAGHPFTHVLPAAHAPFARVAHRVQIAVVAVCPVFQRCVLTLPSSRHTATLAAAVRRGADYSLLLAQIVCRRCRRRGGCWCRRRGGYWCRRRGGCW
eukprot:Sspe_Gene.108347::Locus_87490_Transcript_1_1_Confidence_1.000_Length_3538::g.108347::m.108347